MSGKNQLAPEGTDGHAFLAFVGRVNVLISGRIVQLLRFGPHQDVFVRQLAEIDFGASNLDRGDGGWRYVLDEHFRLTAGGDLIDGPENNAMDGGVGQMLVEDRNSTR